LGALFSSPSIPTPPVIPPAPPAATPPTLANPSVNMAGANQRAMAAAAAGQGFGSTLTNQGGAAGIPDSSVQTSQRSLLG
jgi:hypothetical protein